jgi:hypothetical protein
MEINLLSQEFISEKEGGFIWCSVKAKIKHSPAEIKLVLLTLRWKE